MTETAQRAEAASVADVRIELAHDEPDARAAAHVLAEVWPLPGGQTPVTAELVLVFAHTGNYVSLAVLGDRTVGTAVAFRAEDEDGPYLHSHIAGVLPAWQGSSVGYALKQHQRRWALANGFDRVTWTFDPLVSRNAYFNVTKLGARLTNYHVNYYGPMNDGINSGDETDRCVATWSLDADRVVAAAAGEHRLPDIEALRRDGAGVALRVGTDGGPVVTPHVDGTARLLQLPTDIVAMRAAVPQLARQWRESARELLVAAFADGYEVSGVTRDSWYVLDRSDNR